LGKKINVTLLVSQNAIDPHCYDDSAEKMPNDVEGRCPQAGVEKPSIVVPIEITSGVQKTAETRTCQHPTLRGLILLTTSQI